MSPLSAPVLGSVAASHIVLYDLEKCLACLAKHKPRKHLKQGEIDQTHVSLEWSSGSVSTTKLLPLSGMMWNECMGHSWGYGTMALRCEPRQTRGAAVAVLRERTLKL